MNESELSALQRVQSAITPLLTSKTLEPLPDAAQVAKASLSVKEKLPENGHGVDATCTHLLNDIVPGLNAASLSPTYYGFVTGGVTPAARIADGIVTAFDQNVQVHLPKETIATLVEDRSLSLLAELFDFSQADWPIRTFTTGATASNVLGLACGREFVVSEKLRREGLEIVQGEGLLGACKRACIEKFQVLTTLPHSSLGKAANIVGIGSNAVVDVSQDGDSLLIDTEKLEKYLASPNTASVVVLSCGDVNTGGFATRSVEDVERVRSLCDTYAAWIHVDAAFGLFARVLPSDPKYAFVRSGTVGLELVDSIGGDGHKLLNVPYDCGFFFCSNEDVPPRVFQNTNAPYLNAVSNDGVKSPLNLRMENSARFRGLPVYATLLAYGAAGYSAMVSRMVDLARKIVVYIEHDCRHLELLPHGLREEQVFICVLFRAKDDSLNHNLTERIKLSRAVYASETKWEGKPATRLAIAKWDVDVDRDFATVRRILSALDE